MSKMRGFLLIAALGLLFAAEAKFIPNGEDGTAARAAVTAALAEADALAAVLSGTDPAAWPETWRDTCGTAAAEGALAAVNEVRMALAELRDGWDCLSVQTVSLKKGWNAFYLYVDDPAPAAAAINPSGYAARLRARVATGFVNPSATGPAEILARIATLAANYVAARAAAVKCFSTSVTADWPMSDVYVYMGSTDAAVQFATDVSAEAKASNPYLTWSAAAPDSVNLDSLPAGHVCTAFSTSGVSRTVALLGTSVQAGAMTWHKTGGSDNPAEWNYLGLNVPGTGKPTSANILKDLDFTVTSVAKLYGTDPTKPAFEIAGAGKSLTAADGEVLIADASASSTWFPAPTASPARGVTIAAGATETTFQLRNDTAAAQTVTGTLHRAGFLQTSFEQALARAGVRGVQIQASAVRGWETWNFTETATSNTVFTDTLAAGETRTYRVRFARAAYDLVAREGAYADGCLRTFAATMRFRYGGNAACTYLSLAAASDNNEITSPWPTGLWVGTLAFDRVSQVKGNQTIVHNVPARGRMNVRAIVHVDVKGVCRLLHHVTLQSVTATNEQGTVYVDTSLYAGTAKPADASLGTVTRVDSIAMDIDHPVVDGTGTFTNALSFAWTMAPRGRGNPFHHPYHPEHDGLAWDFKTAAPSGDDMNNYRQGKVKPETWSIRNAVELVAEGVDPMELPDTVTGTCTWTLGNVRRQVNGEDIRASGTFALKRLQAVGKLNQ